MSDDHMVIDSNESFSKEGIPPQKSIEGYVVIATNVHEEATDEDLDDFFGEFGIVRSLHLNLDKQTGYVKGYALIEYRSIEEASAAVQEANGSELLGQILNVDFAFVQDTPIESRTSEAKNEKPTGYLSRRDRSPERR